MAERVGHVSPLYPAVLTADALALLIYFILFSLR
jgi:hypothetical protein